MSEFMGLISGQYDAKKDGFKPGGASLHSIMTAHGPDRQVFEASSLEELKPVRYSNDALAFMFESNQMMSVTKFAHRTGDLQQDYYKCWQGLGKYFDKMDINAGPK
jgi:homogentisate 1,2-dioxygenase